MGLVGALLRAPDTCTCATRNRARSQIGNNGPVWRCVPNRHTSDTVMNLATATDPQIAHALIVAKGVHAGQLDGDGTPMVDRLSLTAELLADCDDPALVCAALLRHVPQAAGITGADLLQLGTPRDIVHLVQALQPRGDELEAHRLGRLRQDPRTAIVELAARLVTRPGRAVLTVQEEKLARAAGPLSLLVLSRSGFRYANA